MTTFSGGPASGSVLQLRRAPFFLRVTKDAKGFDALDQTEDEPKASEQLFAYIIDGRPGQCHIRARHASGFYTIASYKFIEQQPKDNDMRTTGSWAQWCMENASRYGFEQWLLDCKREARA